MKSFNRFNVTALRIPPSMAGSIGFANIPYQERPTNNQLHTGYNPCTFGMAALSTDRST
jgi:hypothetical protein